MLKIVLQNAYITPAVYDTMGRIVCNVATEELGGMIKK